MLLKQFHRHYVNILLNLILVLLLSACINSSANLVVKQDKRKIAYIKTILSNIKLNGYALPQNRKEKMDIGNNNISFDGLVLIKIPKEPLIRVGKEKSAAAAVGACVMALPLCPLSLLFINMAVGTTTLIETNCYGDIIFDAWENETYSIKLIDIEKTYPELRIANKSDVVIARTTLKCEVES